jgi:acyl-CoA reductase-like NAD-dependent aldehyde dehydrogenase
MNIIYPDHTFQSINPATGEVVASYPGINGTEPETRLAGAMGTASVAARAAVLSAIAASSAPSGRN